MSSPSHTTNHHHGQSQSQSHNHGQSHNTHSAPHGTSTRVSTATSGGGGGGGSALKRLLQLRRPASPSHRTLSHDHNSTSSGGNNHLGGRSVQSLSVVNSVALARPASATNHQRPRLQGQGLSPGFTPGQGLARPASASAIGQAGSSTGGRATDKGLTLSHHDSQMQFKLNPKVKGYMGYEFPKNAKPLKRDYYNAARPTGEPPCSFAYILTPFKHTCARPYRFHLLLSITLSFNQPP